MRALGAEGASARVSGAFTGSPRWGRVLDVTPRGLGLLLPAPLEAGTPLYVELQGPRGRLRYPVVARVTGATPRPGGGFRVGCSLARPLPEDILLGLTAGGG
jgi:hypothetical protein